MKVLYITSEAWPFAMSGGLADVSGALPKALLRRRTDCRVVLPLYESISEELRKDMKFVGSYVVPLSWRRQYCGIYEAKVGRVTYYLLDNQYYFKRAELYGHFDDAERFAFFARAALELLRYIDFAPDVLHCNDWQCALVPVYKTIFYGEDPLYQKIKTLLTIHNIQYQGRYCHGVLGDVFGIPSHNGSLLEYDGGVNILKGGIETADAVNTVSPTYSQEILTPEYSHGLHYILRERAYKLSGIVNGIDTEVYDPKKDKAIAAPYSAEQPQAKQQNKAALQKELGLPERADVPLIGMVSRLVGHKGFDLVKQCLDEILQSRDVQVAVLGTGDSEYQNFFAEMQQKYPQKLAFYQGFVPALAHRIYAGADLFLMPSISEPCGLAQMIALRYGTVPIVRQTGGLKDTVSDAQAPDGDKNGFTFIEPSGFELGRTLNRALDAYADADAFAALQLHCMQCDNSWSRSAAEYLALYKSL
ncbi:MAG: glycogen synthase GlgA [Clostridia bacterium]|nr:glycogen synthase GlgA [Clostridia bacterium]